MTENAAIAGSSQPSDAAFEPEIGSSLISQNTGGASSTANDDFIAPLTNDQLRALEEADPNYQSTATVVIHTASEEVLSPSQQIGNDSGEDSAIPISEVRLSAPIFQSGPLDAEGSRFYTLDAEGRRVDLEGETLAEAEQSAANALAHGELVPAQHHFSNEEVAVAETFAVLQPRLFSADEVVMTRTILRPTQFATAEDAENYYAYLNDRVNVYQETVTGAVAPFSYPLLANFDTLLEDLPGPVSAEFEERFREIGAGDRIFTFTNVAPTVVLDFADLANPNPSALSRILRGETDANVFAGGSNNDFLSNGSVPLVSGAGDGVQPTFSFERVDGNVFHVNQPLDPSLVDPVVDPVVDPIVDPPVGENTTVPAPGSQNQNLSGATVANGDMFTFRIRNLSDNPDGFASTQQGQNLNLQAPESRVTQDQVMIADHLYQSPEGATLRDLSNATFNHPDLAEQYAAVAIRDFMASLPADTQHEISVVVISNESGYSIQPYVNVGQIGRVTSTGPNENIQPGPDGNYYISVVHSHPIPIGENVDVGAQAGLSFGDAGAAYNRGIDIAKSLQVDSSRVTSTVVSIDLLTGTTTKLDPSTEEVTILGVTGFLPERVNVQQFEDGADNFVTNLDQLISPEIQRLLDLDPATASPEDIQLYFDLNVANLEPEIGGNEITAQFEQNTADIIADGVISPDAATTYGDFLDVLKATSSDLQVEGQTDPALLIARIEVLAEKSAGQGLTQAERTEFAALTQALFGSLPSSVSEGGAQSSGQTGGAAQPRLLDFTDPAVFEFQTEVLNANADTYDKFLSGEQLTTAEIDQVEAYFQSILEFVSPSEDGPVGPINLGPAQRAELQEVFDDAIGELRSDGALSGGTRGFMTMQMRRFLRDLVPLTTQGSQQSSIPDTSGVAAFVPAELVAAAPGGEDVATDTPLGVASGYEIDPETGGLLLASEELSAADRDDVADNPALVSQITAYALFGAESIDRGTDIGFGQGVAFDQEVRALIHRNEHLSVADVEALEAELFVDAENGLYVLQPTSSLSPELQAFQEAVTALPEGPDVSAQVSSLYDASQLTPSANGLITNPEFRDARFGEATAAELDEDAYVAVFDYTYDRNANLLLAAESAPDSPAAAAARAELEAQGLTFLENGLLDRSEGGGALQLARLSADLAVDPATNDAVSGFIAAGQAPLDAAGGVVDPEADPEVPPPTDPAFDGLTSDEARAEVYRQLDAEIADAFNEAGDNFSPITGFLLTGIRNAISFGDQGDLDPAFFGDLLTGNGPAFTYLLGRIGDGDYAAYGELLPELGQALIAAGADIGEAEIAGLTGSVVIGEFLQIAGRDANNGEGDDALFVAGTAIIGASESLVEVFRGSERAIPILDGEGNALLDPDTGEPLTETVEVDVEQRVANIAVDAASELLNYFGTKYDQPELVQAGAVGELGYDVFQVFQGDLGVDDLIAPFGEAVGSFFSGEASGAIQQGFGIGGDVVGLFSGAGPNLEGVKVFGDTVIDFGSLGDSLSGSSFYTTGGTVSRAAEVLLEFLDLVGVDVPPEVAYAVTTIARAFAGPVGWASIVIDAFSRILSTETWTVSTPYWTQFDADGDLLQDDDSFIDTDFSSNFFGEVHVQGGEIRYEINGVNPDLLEEATFTLSSAPTLSLTTRIDSDDDFEVSLTLNGETFSGSIRHDGERVDEEGTIDDGDDGRNSVSSGVFVSSDGSITAPVVIEHDDDGRSADFSLAEGAGDGFPSNYRLHIEGSYSGLNPETGGEDFERTVPLTLEQYELLHTELGGEAPVTLAGTDPLLNDGPGLLTPGGAANTSLAQIMSGLQVEFESERRVANIYKYRDVNGDGNLDLIRYGINQDGDGLNIGDERYEITFLDVNGDRLGVRDASGSTTDANGVPYGLLPTIVAPTEAEAVEIGSLAPYLFAWAAARPELGFIGHDPVSIYNAVQEAGQLDEMLTLRNLDYERRVNTSEAYSQLGDVGALFSDDPEVASAASAEITANIEALQADPAQTAATVSQLETTNEQSLAAQELRVELGLFSASAYSAANPDLGSAAGAGAMEAAYHYLLHGNQEERVINGSGATLPVGTQPAWPGVIYRGATLEVGERLQKNEMLLSGNGQYAAYFNDDGDLFIYDLSSGEPQQIWEADLNGGTDDGWAEITEEGDFVVRDDDNDIEFSSNTGTEGAHGNFALIMSDDGNLNLVDVEDGRVLWAAGRDGFDQGGDGVTLTEAGAAIVDPTNDRSAGSHLEIVGTVELQDVTLTAGQALVSGDGAFALEFTEQGTLRLVDNRTGLYDLLSNDAASLGSDATVEIGRDGAFRVRDVGGDVVWTAGTETPGVDRPIFLRLHDDGGLALVDSQFNQPLWSWDAGLIDNADQDIEVIGSALTAGADGVLSRGEAILSPDGLSVLALTDDGVLSVRNMATQAETVLIAGGADSVQVQANGNIVARDANGADVWSTGTYHQADPSAVSRAFTLTVGSDGVAALIDPEFDQPLWTSSAGLLDRPAPALDLIGAQQTGGVITPGQALISSNGDFVLALEFDGALTLRNTITGEVRKIADAGADAVLDLQDDGHLVLYTAGRDDVSFATDTYFDTDEGVLRPFTLTLGDDGDVLWRDADSGAALWTLNAGHLQDAAPQPQTV